MAPSLPKNGQAKSASQIILCGASDAAGRFIQACCHARTFNTHTHPHAHCVSRDILSPRANLGQVVHGSSWDGPTFCFSPSGKRALTHMATITQPIALYAHRDVDVARIMHEVRSSGYLEEIVSGESSLEESPLWNLVQPQSSVSTLDEALRAFQQLDSNYVKCAFFWVNPHDAFKNANNSAYVVRVSESGDSEGESPVDVDHLLEIAAHISAGVPYETLLKE